MVLIGAMGVVLSFYSFWLVGTFETKWLKTFWSVVCGFMCAAALLWTFCGLERGEIVYNHSVDLMGWLVSETE
jgi:hypothetical protein